jgi:Est1 DNA/RNA binding domain
VESARITAYLTFNLKVFFVLLGILVSEVADLEEAAIHDNPGTDGSEKLTVVARRVLPALRHYSGWLRSSCSSLHRQTEETVAAHVGEFWKRYAEALTVLTTTFDVVELPSVNYLLEEDLDTVAFTPLSTGISADRYREDDHIKPKIGDVGVQRLDPNREMLARVRSLVLDAIQIVIEDVSIFNARVESITDEHP